MSIATGATFNSVGWTHAVWTGTKIVTASNRNIYVFNPDGSFHKQYQLPQTGELIGGWNSNSTRDLLLSGTTTVRAICPGFCRTSSGNVNEQRIYAFSPDNGSTSLGSGTIVSQTTAFRWTEDSHITSAWWWIANSAWLYRFAGDVGIDFFKYTAGPANTPISLAVRDAEGAAYFAGGISSPTAPNLMKVTEIVAGAWVVPWTTTFGDRDGIRILEVSSMA